MEEKNSESIELTSQTAALIARDFGLDIGTEPMTEQELFEILANEVAYMIEYRIDTLMSLLYRLDVLEPHIQHALSPLAADPPNVGLAKLILERQKQRIITKKKYKQSPLGEDEDLAL